MPDEYKLLHFPAESVQAGPGIADLPESARRVFDAILQHAPATHSHLRAATGMPARTIRFAVKRLKDQGYIDSMRSLRDCRTCYFFVSPKLIGADAIEAARRQAAEESKAGRLMNRV